MNIEKIEALNSRVLSAAQDVQASRDTVKEAEQRLEDAQADLAEARPILNELVKLLKTLREELDEEFEPWNE